MCDCVCALVPECKHSLVPASKTWHSVVCFLLFSIILDILWSQRLCNWLMNYEKIFGWVHIWLYVVHQYFQRHVAAAVRVWLVLVTCGRPLVGHSDWINSHQKHAVDWVVCSCTRPRAGPRVSDIASRHHENCSFSLAPASAWHGEALWCHTPAERWMEEWPKKEREKTWGGGLCSVMKSSFLAAPRGNFCWFVLEAAGHSLA